MTDTRTSLGKWGHNGANRLTTGIASLWVILVGMLACLILLGGCTAERKADRLEPDGRITLYFNNDSLAGSEARCDLVFPVTRTLAGSRQGADAALKELLKGPTPEELAQGYRSFFSPNTAGLLKRLKIQAGTAYVDLHEPPSELAAATSSCGSAEFFSQIERTLAEFPEIRRVRYAIEGDPAAFHDWMESECSERDERCDPAPFAAP